MKVVLENGVNGVLMNVLENGVNGVLMNVVENGTSVTKYVLRSHDV